MDHVSAVSNEESQALCSSLTLMLPFWTHLKGHGRTPGEQLGTWKGRVCWLSWPGSPSSCWKRVGSEASLGSLGFPPSVVSAFAALCSGTRGPRGEAREVWCSRSPPPPPPPHPGKERPTLRPGFYICLEALCFVHTRKQQSHKTILSLWSCKIL